MSVVDPDATVAFLRREAATAGRHDDGHRAWVVRDASRSSARRSRSCGPSRGGIRRRPSAASTSRAAAAAAAFTGLGVASPRPSAAVVDHRLTAPLT